MYPFFLNPIPEKRQLIPAGSIMHSNKHLSFSFSLTTINDRLNHIETSQLSHHAIKIALIIHSEEGEERQEPPDDSGGAKAAEKLSSTDDYHEARFWLGKQLGTELTLQSIQVLVRSCPLPPVSDIPSSWKSILREPAPSCVSRCSSSRWQSARASWPPCSTLNSAPRSLAGERHPTASTRSEGFCCCYYALHPFS